MTPKLVVLSLLLFAVTAGQALAHAGEVHSYMGTVTKADREITMTTTKGEEISFVTSNATSYRFSDNSPAQRSDITVGSRVVVEVSKDGRTASSVKIARKKN